MRLFISSRTQNLAAALKIHTHTHTHTQSIRARESCSPDDRRNLAHLNRVFLHLQEVFNAMRDSQSNFSQDGQLATLIADIDKGPLLAWLLISDWETIRHFRLTTTVPIEHLN